MNFRKLKGVRRPYKEQGLIHFLCVNYPKLSKEERKKIDDLCQTVGEFNSRALFVFVTSERSAVSVADEYHVSESTLYRLRREFYELWKL